MSRLITFLNEKDIHEKEIFDIIKKECKLYFKKFKKDKFLFYSGIKRTDDWFKGKIFKKRLPVDTPKEIHELANKHFKNKFGAPLRSECLFAYGLLGYTGHYGNPYIILPIGNFDIYWHSRIIDFFGDLDDRVSNEFAGLQLMDLKMRELNYEIIKKIIEFLDKEIKNIVNKYVKNKPPVDRGLEIMIHGDKYYALSTAWINPNDYMHKIWEMFDEA